MNDTQIEKFWFQHKQRFSRKIARMFERYGLYPHLVEDATADLLVHFLKVISHEPEDRWEAYCFQKLHWVVLDFARKPYYRSATHQALDTVPQNKVQAKDEDINQRIDSERMRAAVKERLSEEERATWDAVAETNNYTGFAEALSRKLGKPISRAAAYQRRTRLGHKISALMLEGTGGEASLQSRKKNSVAPASHSTL